jgi:hypothetical protein
MAANHLPLILDRHLDLVFNRQSALPQLYRQRTMINRLDESGPQRRVNLDDGLDDLIGERIPIGGPFIPPIPAHPPISLHSDRPSAAGGIE